MARIMYYVEDPEVAWILNNQELLLYPEPVDWDWDSDNEATLVYKAIRQNDATVMKDLLRTGINVNAEILSGDTALLMALKLCKWEAAKALLDADADVSVTDASTGRTALKFLFIQSKTVKALLVPHLVGNLKRSNLDAEKLADLLVAANCPLTCVLSLNNAQVTQKFLERNSFNNYISIMKPAIYELDFESVEFILRYGNSHARSSFYSVLIAIYMMGNKIELWRAFIKRLADWDVVSEEGLIILGSAFMRSDMEFLQVLFDSKIDGQVREKFGIDLRASIFGNRRVDAIELLKNQNFKVNASGACLRTALHFAALGDVVKNVQFLLDLGAHVDIQDVDGKTPLSLSVSHNSNCINSGQLLLEHGADVQIMDKNGLTVFEIAHNKKSSLMELLIAQLAINGIQGLPIKQSIQDIITSNEEYTNIYEACCQQLQILKSCEITKPVTLKISETCEIIKRMSLFNVLTDKIETLCRFVQNRDIVSLLDQHQNRQEFHPLYYSALKIKLINTSKLYSFKCDIAEIITQSTGNIIDFDNLVVKEISKYLSQKDIDKFLK